MTSVSTGSGEFPVTGRIQVQVAEASVLKEGVVLTRAVFYRLFRDDLEPPGS